MSKLLDYLNALDTNAVLIQAHKSDPYKAAKEFGLTIEEQAVLLKQSRQQIAAFLDIPFADFDSLDTTEIGFRSWEIDHENADTREEAFAA
ncbi:hypothetical protein [Undibacterium sp. TJN19]|uniref:hypothetical protein n=1 Tax=Undibacterium sp. TJN19 TaxID=3413055 RepID=UPI003BF3691A